METYVIVVKNKKKKLMFSKKTDLSLLFNLSHNLSRLTEDTICLLPDEISLLQTQQIEQLVKRNASLEREVASLKDSCVQMAERLESVESKIPSLTYLVDRNLELEYMDCPYSLDGISRCNS